MTLDDFLSKKEKVNQLSVQEQKDFYEPYWKNTQDKTKVRVYASFFYGQLFCEEGDFQKTIEIIEPIVLDYTSYPYTTKILACFNLIGVASHCESEYSISRFFYETALKVAHEHNERLYYGLEYNNIATAYLYEKNYQDALRYLSMAAHALPDCDEEMGAYVYVNQCLALRKLNRLSDAQRALDTAVQQYHADTILPDDVLRNTTMLYYQLGDMPSYECCRQKLLDGVATVEAAELIDVCKDLFECALNSNDEALMATILGLMHQHMNAHPDEIKVEVAFASLEYQYAERKGDKDAMLRALQKENHDKDCIIAQSLEKRVHSLSQYIEINSQISDLELDALTHFKNRKTYYKDTEFLAHDPATSQRPVGVIFADINGLKETNDQFGHDAGDALIAKVAAGIAATFPDARKYRFGGDEFVILSFDKSKVDFDAKLDALAKEWDGKCSVSIGNVWQEHAEDFEKAVTVADEMMYMAKSRYYENHLHDRRQRRRVSTEESLKKIEAIAEYLPGGFFIYHADGDEQMITCNQELLKIFGCQNKEEFAALTGNSFRGMVHPDDLNIVERNISSQIKQEKDIDRVRYRIRCKDGVVKTVLDYGRFVHTEKYGDVYYVFLNVVFGENE